MTPIERTEALIWFTQEMLDKLTENEHKGGWRLDTFKRLYRLMMIETVELAEVLFENDSIYTEIIKECADVANFAMMIADRARKLREGT